MSPVRSPSPWWGLLVLPLALGGGWLLGSTAALDRPAPAATVASVRASSPPGASAAPPSPASPAAEAPRSLFETPTPRTGVVSSWTSYDGALAESRSTGKAILLDFNAAWCPPCQMLKRDVFDHPESGRAVCTEVVPVSLVDRKREDGSNPPGLDELQARFRVDAFPTLVVFSPATGREQRLRGYAGREHTVRWIAEAAASVR